MWLHAYMDALHSRQVSLHIAATGLGVAEQLAHYAPDGQLSRELLERLDAEAWSHVDRATRQLYAIYTRNICRFLGTQGVLLDDPSDAVSGVHCLNTTEQICRTLGDLPAIGAGGR